MAGRNPTLILPSGGIIRKYPFVAWENLKPAIQWDQGQHVLSVGGTGSGKSTIAGEFLPRRKLVVVMVSKGMDDIFEGPYYRDYETVGHWTEKATGLKALVANWRKEPDVQRLLLRPGNQKSIPLTKAGKTMHFARCFDDVLLRRGRWCIDVDETHYVCETLKLEQYVTDMLEQGRSALISMWNNTQRPAGIPLATYVNSSHGFFFTSQEEYDVRRLGRMRNKHTNAKEMMANVERLDSFENHEFIYLDRSGRIEPVRSIVTIRKR